MNDTTYISTESPKTCRPYKHFRFFSWSAVFAGALVGVGLGFLFNLLNLALGFFVLTTETGKDIDTLAIGGLIWLVVCGIITMFLAGWVAGKVARCCYYKRSVGLVHGFCAWVVALIITFVMLAHLGVFLHGGSAVAQTAANYSSTSSPTKVVNQSVGTVSSPVKGTTNDKLVVDQKSSEVSSKGTFGLFLIFFVGAVSSCIGGLLGIGRRPHEYYETTTTTNNRIVP